MQFFSSVNTLTRALPSVILGIAWSSSIAAENETLPALKDAPMVHADSPFDAGRYLVFVGGCNDCHTVNWAETNGDVPEQEWLTGSPIGWRGPWGTTYPSNLRMLVHDMSEDAWVVMLRTRKERPPMPWMNMNQLSDSDSRAIYRFIRSLGIKGERMPAAIDPASEPTTPYFLLEPVQSAQLESVAEPRKPSK